MKDLRRTGRTRRMLEHTKRLNAEGKTVYVIADNHMDRRRLTMLLGADAGGIKVETPQTVGNFDWETLRLIGAHRDCVVLVDHHAIEDRYAGLLQMLHAYDQ